MILDRSLARVLLATVVLAFAATPALSDENRGFYAGGGLGQFGLAFDAEDIDLDELDFDDSDTAYKIFAGWRFNPYIALELDYMDLGSPSETLGSGTLAEEVGIGLDGYAPYLVGTLPLGFLELSAKVGYLIYNVDIDTDDFSESDSDEAFAYGIGAGVVVLEHLALRLEWERFEVSDVDKAEAWWVTAAWRF